MSILDDVIKIVNKFIPDKNAQVQAEIELRKLNIEHLKEKGKYLEKINECIPFVLPSFLLILAFMFLLNYLTDWFYSCFIGEAPVIHIDDRLVEFCKWFVRFLFGKKTIEKFSNNDKK